METTPRRGSGFQKPQAVTVLRQGQKGTASSTFVSETQTHLEEVTQIPLFLCLSCPHALRPAPLPRPKGGQQPVFAASLLPYHNILKAWSHISSISFVVRCDTFVCHYLPQSWYVYPLLCVATTWIDPGEPRGVTTPPPPMDDTIWADEDVLALSPRGLLVALYFGLLQDTQDT